MYDVTITNGNNQRIIHDHRGASNAQKLPSGTIVDAENAISSFTFTIYPNNAGYDELNALSTQIRVRNTKRNRDAFVGRVLQVNPSMDSSGVFIKQVICEDRLGFLHDSIQPYAEVKHYTGDSSRTGLEEFIDILLENHNAQVESYKRIYRGTVTVKPFESSNDVTKGLNWQTTYESIKEKLLNSFGGYIRLRESGGALYLDYLESVGTTRSTEITVGRNMRSASKEIDPSGIVTRLVPLGAKIKMVDESGAEVETEERLTIDSVNAGLKYIVSGQYENQYGIRYGTVIFDDVTDASNLLRKGTEWLTANNGLAISHQIDAIDLSLIGLDIDDFVLYDRYPVRNLAIGINDVLQIVKKNTDIVEAQNGSFEMGSTTKRFSDAFIDSLVGTQGEPGKDGKPGVPGAAGVGVARVVPRYALGSSNTAAPSAPSIAGWTILAPDVPFGKYLWCAYYVEYTDGTDAWTEPFVVRSADQLTQSGDAPANPVVGTLWLDTSTLPYSLFRYNGTGWDKIDDYSNSFEEVYTYVNTSLADLKVKDDEILATVEETTVAKSVYEEFSQTLKNILSMEADGTTMIFQTINEAIQQVGATEESHYAELLTYIRFNENGIEIGKQGNAITMQLDNDSLDFYNNGTRVAYISDNQLYITDGRFLRSVRIGNYGFIPEVNGSVSFTYLGGES